jgi:hypothetical protein
MLVVAAVPGVLIVTHVACLAGHLGSIRVILHVALNSLEVRALALPILPHGLYTESAVVVIKTRSPPTAWATSWIRNILKSPVDNVVATAIRAMRLTDGICISSTPVATTVSTSFATIQ